MLYVLLPTDQARQARGKRVRIYEDEDGNTSIRHNGVELAARPFPKDGVPAPQGVVVDNKRLADTLAHMRGQQQAREQQRLEAAGTRRQRRLIQRKLAAN